MFTLVCLDPLPPVADVAGPFALAGAPSPLSTHRPPNHPATSKVSNTIQHPPTTHHHTTLPYPHIIIIIIIIIITIIFFLSLRSPCGDGVDPWHFASPPCPVGPSTKTRSEQKGKCCVLRPLLLSGSHKQMKADELPDAGTGVTIKLRFTEPLVGLACTPAGGQGLS